MGSISSATTILFTLLFIMCLLYMQQRYRRISIIILFVWFLCRSLNLFVVQWRTPPRHTWKPKEAITKEIKEGDLIQVFSAKDTRAKNLFSIVRLLDGTNMLYSAIVVKDHGELYLLNNYGAADFKKRLTLYSNPLEIKILSKEKGWVFFLEPVDLFLEAEQKRSSLIHLYKNNQSIDYSPEVLHKVVSKINALSHSCSNLGNYLEHSGRIAKRRWHPSWMFYLPTELIEQLRPQEKIEFMVYEENKQPPM
jgi:hypothetical protein